VHSLLPTLKVLRNATEGCMHIVDIPRTNLTDEAPVGQVRPQRAVWSKPEVRRLAMSEAETGVSIHFDASEGFS